MKTSKDPFDLPAWRRRMQWTQARAAEELGLTVSGYQHAEYRSTDLPGNPVNRTVVILAKLLEERR